MGMTILQAKQRLHDKWMELTKNGTDEEMMQALCIADTVLGDYDESLKADMVAMLTELKTEIEKKELYYQDKFLESKNAVHDSAMCGRMFGCGECKEDIQQKIDKLKGVANDI